MNMTFSRLAPFFLIFCLLMVLASLGVLLVFGLRPGIDFAGGSIMEVEYQGMRPSNEEVMQRLSGLDIGLESLQPAGERNLIIKMKDIPEHQHQLVLSLLGADVKELRFESIGPVVGKELRESTLFMAALSSFIIVLYIALAFRQHGGKVHSWEYSLAALIVTMHDLVVPLGVFAVLGRFQDLQVGIPVIVGLLTVLGYSINDTIVVFDRVRENLRKRTGATLEDTIGISVRQTFGRSLSTSFTVLLVLVALYVWGGATLKPFALVLIAGVIAGTYSSILLAPPLLLFWHKRNRT
ncbi:MAG: protein translocase subunit SecF [Parcubacteria group bacterium]|nr:protein translocase subunit SecF [Parcubacteria group bacterium]